MVWYYRKIILTTSIILILAAVRLWLGLSSVPPRTPSSTSKPECADLTVRCYEVLGTYSVFSSGQMLGSHYALRIVMNESGIIEGNFTNQGLGIYLLTAAQYNSSQCSSCFPGPNVTMNNFSETGRVNPAGYLYSAGYLGNSLGGPTEAGSGNFSWSAPAGTYYLWLQGEGNSGETIEPLEWTSTITFHPFASNG